MGKHLLHGALTPTAQGRGGCMLTVSQPRLFVYPSVVVESPIDSVYTRNWWWWSQSVGGMGATRAVYCCSAIASICVGYIWELHGTMRSSIPSFYLACQVDMLNMRLSYAPIYQRTNSLSQLIRSLWKHVRAVEIELLCTHERLL